MAQFPERGLTQTAVYWGTPTSDGYGGFTFADPVEIDCRWYDSTRLFVDDKGKEAVSQARVQVKQDLDKDGMLYLGTLDDLDSTEEADPRTVDGAYPILRFDKSITIKGKYFRIAYL